MTPKPVIVNAYLMSDAAIVKMIMAKDPQAMRILYDKYAPAIYGLITVTIGCNSEADSLLSKTFLQIWRDRQTYDDQVSLFKWLISTTRNTALKHFKPQRRLLEKSLPLQYQVESENISVIKLLSLTLIWGFTCESLSDHLGIPTEELKKRVLVNLSPIPRSSE